MSYEATPRLDHLLAHAAWLRRLARALVKDPEAADDAAQETWLAAVRRPPAEGGNARAWLRAVLNNVVRQRHRTDSRRERRELDRARTQDEALPADAGERLGLHRQLVELVDALPEPRRSSVLMRYFEDLPLREIAARQGVPLATVNTRLRKAREELREALDRCNAGDRAAWTSALLPLASAAGPSAPVRAGSTLLAGRWFLVPALGLALCAVFTLPLWSPERGEPLVSAADAGTGDAREVVAPAVDAPLAAENGERAEAGEVLPEPEQATHAAAVRPVLDWSARGRVVDVAGRAVAGRPVVFTPREGEEQRRTSDVDGRFLFERLEVSGELRVEDELYGNVLGSLHQPAQAREHLLVVAPKHPIAGWVRDPLGTEVAGAFLEFHLPPGYRGLLARDLGRSLDLDSAIDFTGGERRSGPLGEFRLDACTDVPGAFVRVGKEGFEERDFPLPPTPQEGLVLELRPLEGGEHVRGQVLDPAGRGVRGALVSLGFRTTTSGEGGHFRVRADRPGTEPVLRAVARGWLPAEMRAEGEWPEHCVLRLEGAPLTLSGRVVDAEGAPLAGLEVWPQDATFFGMLEGTGAQLEGLLAGDGGGHPEPVDEAGWKAVAPRAWCPRVETGADGCFELTGLLPRDYRLRVYDPELLLWRDFGPFAAGRAGLELRWNRDADRATLEGIVLTEDGLPLAGVAVRVSCRPFTAPHGEGGTLSRVEQGAQVTTGEDGRFVLEGLPRAGVLLRLEHPDAMPRTVEAGELARDGEPVELRLRHRFHLQVEAAQESARQEVEVHDEEGGTVELKVFGAGGFTTADRLPLTDGVSEVLSVDGRAHTVVLFDGGEEVARRALRLEAGELNRVRFP